MSVLWSCSCMIVEWFWKWRFGALEGYNGGKIQSGIVRWFFRRYQGGGINGDGCHIIVMTMVVLKLVGHLWLFTGNFKSCVVRKGVVNIVEFKLFDGRGR